MCNAKHAAVESSYEPMYDIVYYGELDFIESCEADLEFDEEESEEFLPELYLPGIEDDTIH